MKSTYDQIEKLASKVVIHYLTDLTEHDQKILSDYDGPFLYGYRPCGTDILRLLPDLQSYKAEFKTGIMQTDLIKFVKEEIVWIIYPDRNTNFLYFDGKELKKVTSDKAKLIHQRHIEKVISEEFQYR